MAGKITLTEVKNCTATINDILAINALLDMQHDIEVSQQDRSK